MRRVVSASSATLLLVVLVQVTAAGAGSQPVVTAVRAPATATADVQFAATVVVKNRGARRSGRVAMKVVLSTDTALDDQDQAVATVRVPALRPRARKTFQVQVAPATAGAQYLLACVRQRCRNAPVQVNPAETEPGEDPAEPPSAGNPLDVSPVLDAGRAVSARITATDGGTITATGVDGSTFELVIPPDGLLGDEEITLTPVTSLGSDPFAAPVAAVDIQPHGLQLGRLATLTITPAAPIPLDQQFFFATREGGKDFHAYPPTQDATKIELQLSHFSIDGVAPATPAERSAAALRAPADAQAQLEKIVGEQVQEMKRNGSFDGDALVPNVLEWYRRVVKPRLLQAVVDDSLTLLATGSFLGWQRQTELFAVEEIPAVADLIAEGNTLMLQAMAYAFDKASARCLAGETAYLRVMLSMERTLTLMGLAVDGEALVNFLKCARYELDFDARVELHNQDNATQGQIAQDYEVAVSAHDVELLTTLDEKGTPVTTGTAPLVVLHWRYANSASYATDWAAGNAELVAPLMVEAHLPLGFRLETDTEGRTRYVLVKGRPRVDLDPGKVKLSYTKGGTFQYPSIYNFEDLFLRSWRPERLTSRPGFYLFSAFFDALDPKLGLFLAERSNHSDVNNFVVDDFGWLRMDIEHAPPP